MARVLSAVKQRVLALYGDTTGPRTILAGLNRGVRMNLDLASDTQCYLGLGERELAQDFSHLSEGIETAIDCGGSSGFYTLFFLMKTPAKRVLCFEPDDECYGRISANLDLNHLKGDPRLEFFHKFVGSKDDEQTISLNSLVDRIRTPCLIKIDVEEAEVDVLAGATKLIGMPGVRWIIETHRADIEVECVRILSSAGLRPRIVDKAWWRAFVRELRPSAHNRWLVA